MKIHADVILSIVLLLSGTARQAIERPSNFIISSPRDTYTVYEPIQITFMLTNDRDKQIEGEFGLGFFIDQLNVFYRKEGEKFHPYASERTEQARAIEYTYVTKIPIPGRGQISVDEILLYDIRAERFVFSEPGVYEFRAKYRYTQNDYSKIMESNTLRVMVLPRPSEESQEALSLWKDPHLARVIQGDWAYTEEKGKLVRLVQRDWLDSEEIMKGVIERLKPLVENYPKSIYTRAAKAAIAPRYEKREKLMQGLTPSEKALLKLVRQ
jgi:hypothetical protein